MKIIDIKTEKYQSIFDLKLKEQGECESIEYARDKILKIPSSTAFDIFDKIKSLLVDVMELIRKRVGGRIGYNQKHHKQYVDKYSTTVSIEPISDNHSKYSKDLFDVHIAEINWLDRTSELSIISKINNNYIYKGRDIDSFIMALADYLTSDKIIEIIKSTAEMDDFLNINK